MTVNAPKIIQQFSFSNVVLWCVFVSPAFSLCHIILVGFEVKNRWVFVPPNGRAPVFGKGFLTYK